MGKNRHHYGTDGRDSQANHHQPPYARVQFPDVPINLIVYHLHPNHDDKVQYTSQLPPTQTSVGCTSIGDYLNGREFGFDPKNERSSRSSPASVFFNRITHFLSKKVCVDNGAYVPLRQKQERDGSNPLQCQGRTDRGYHEFSSISSKAVIY